MCPICRVVLDEKANRRKPTNTVISTPEIERQEHRQTVLGAVAIIGGAVLLVLVVALGNLKIAPGQPRAIAAASPTATAPARTATSAPAATSGATAAASVPAKTAIAPTPTPTTQQSMVPIGTEYPIGQAIPISGATVTVTKPRRYSTPGAPGEVSVTVRYEAKSTIYVDPSVWHLHDATGRQYDSSYSGTLQFTSLSAGLWTEGTVVFVDVPTSGPLWLDYVSLGILSGSQSWSIEIP